MYRTRVLAALLAAVSLTDAYELVNGNVSQPTSNAAFNITLADYRLLGYNGNDTRLTHGFVQTDCGANLSVHYTNPSVWGNLTGTASRPILILTHGYPESSYIWRDVTPIVSTRVPVFVADQPGYGLSTACCNSTGCAYDKRTYAQSILQAVNKVYGNVNVIYAGHDRGARTMHRAAVDNNFPGITGLGFFAADIVPFIAEYASFSNPVYAQGYFHWAFLPKGMYFPKTRINSKHVNTPAGEFATDVIMTYGGGNWVRQILEYGQGENTQGIEIFKRGQAWEIYINFFNQLSVTNASVFDYQAGAFTDYDEQVADQNAGIKVKLPTHILYSEYNLGAQFDVQQVWSNYTDPSANLTVKSVGDKKGHFIIEEAPDETVAQLNTFMDRLGVSD
ncbi:hypothetical protein M409DRAFT_22336 [Zasmidium cellare ATCC 36951]|uniref:AB hydrolase-1 domain-containing protein n=1 Tax=Zasmidium cellare ATCC 36951 TaxID=1080233 RepID=A0A6A6CP56_ZASCE|nr:uncharacterized protein M409DRAFT_22336 [Zasmidium cellare ATCC 36951]KAF2167529.1 hypothetical protein M409DRAFT_22336 [Zasmidium cellare ATCC 36951]